VVTEVVSLRLIEAPGALGADIVVAEANRSATRSTSVGYVA
jgi:glycine cleavage system pyridoxal-binding protein P